MIVSILTPRSELRLVLVIVVLLVSLSRSSPITDFSETIALAEGLVWHVLESSRKLAWSPAYCNLQSEKKKIIKLKVDRLERENN